MSSRALKDYEKELLNAQVIGKDAIAVLVQSENPVQDYRQSRFAKYMKKLTENWSDIK